MIGAALLFLQVGAAQPATLTVRDASRTIHVPVVATAGGPLVRLDALRPVVPLRLTRPTATEWAVRVNGVELRLQPGLAAVRTPDSVRTLITAPVIRNGHLFVPLQFVSDVMPDVVPNLRWDAQRRALVAFSMGTRTASLPVGPPAPASSDPPRASPSRASSGPTVRLQATSARIDSAVQRRARRASSGRRVVVVDAGHGGVDPGMHGPIGGTGPRIYEKDITLAVAQRLGDELRSRGLEVVYTRTTDTLIALSDRGAIANRAGGDLFISIHVNAANPNWRDPGASRGFETYFLAEARTEDARRVERMENEAIRFEGGPNPDKDDPLSYILSDMIQNEHLRESSELADLVQHSLGLMHPGPNRGVKQAGFRVLVTAYMPAVLVEIGFGTNPSEARFISDPSRQAQMASAIADAAVQYLNRYERRVSGGASP